MQAALANYTSLTRRARPYDLSAEIILDYFIHSCWYADGVRIAGYTRLPGSNRIGALVAFIEIALGRANQLARPSASIPCLISRESLEGLFRENAGTFGHGPAYRRKR